MSLSSPVRNSDAVRKKLSWHAVGAYPSEDLKASWRITALSIPYFLFRPKTMANTARTGYISRRPRNMSRVKTILAADGWAL